jgi:hypothetical protein
MGSTAALQLAGNAMNAGGKIAAGYAQRGALTAASNELTQEAGQSVAAGIQGQEAQIRRTNYVASNAQARIAAGGLSTTGTSAQAVIGGIKGQGEYEALTALFQGEDRASELNYRASQLRTQGSNAIRAGWIGGVSSAISSYPRVASVLSDGTSFFGKYAAGYAYTSQYSGGYINAGSPNFISG